MLNIEGDSTNIFDLIEETEIMIRINIEGLIITFSGVFEDVEEQIVLERIK